MADLVQTIRLGFTNCYLIGDGGVVLVDAGLPGYHRRFVRKVHRLGLSPQKLKLIILTHGHFDHFGSAMKLKELTGAQLAVQKLDAEVIKKGCVVMPPTLNSWGKFLTTIIQPLSFMLHVPAVVPDIVLEDEYSLEEFGIDGSVIHTPGHTQGSVSVLLAGGKVFVGDLAMNGLPFRLGAGMPIFGDSLEQIHNSWRRLLDAGAQVIYPGHGNSFSAMVLEKVLESKIGARVL